MNLAGLITFWALVLAAYAVLPEYWKFRIKAFIGSRVSFVSTSVALVLSLALVSWSMFMDDGDWKTWVQVGAFFVLLVYIAFLLRSLFRGRVTRDNLDRFRELLSSLSVNQQYEILTTAIKDNIKYLPVIYDYIPRSRRPSWFRGKKPGIEKWLPQYQPPSKYQDGVLRLVDQIISDHGFTHFIVNYDIDTPLALIETCENKTFGVGEYLDAVLELLISNPGSQLYREIQTHQNIGRGWRRDIGNSRLLRFLFEDAKLAKQRAIWRPVGNYVMRFLHDRPGGIDDIYNKEANYYTDSFTVDRFSDPVFVGLEFFDFMVKEALIQGVKWHMWLYYFHHWTKEIVIKAKYDPTEWEKGYWEFPTRYTFLLYQIISYQLKWFYCAWENDLDIGLEQGEIDINANILQSASKCLAYCLHAICECRELPDKFKRSLLTLWWNHYFELENYRKGNYPQYAQFLLESMISEIEGTLRPRISFPLLGCLISGLTHVDEIKEWVNDKAYKDRFTEIKQLVQTHVVPALNEVLPEHRADTLRNTLGTEFQLDDLTISVSNRFSMQTDLVCLT